MPLVFRATGAQQVLDLAFSAVRMEMMIKLQTLEAQKKIEKAIVEGAEEFSAGGHIELPMPALVASGRKPVVAVA